MVRYGWQVRKCKSSVFPNKRLLLVTGCCIVLGQKKERIGEGGKEGGERESEDGRKRGRRKIRKERGRREERRKRKMSEKEPLRVMSWWKRGSDAQLGNTFCSGTGVIILKFGRCITPGGNMTPLPTLKLGKGKYMK